MSEVSWSTSEEGKIHKDPCWVLIRALQRNFNDKHMTLADIEMSWDQGWEFAQEHVRSAVKEAFPKAARKNSDCTRCENTRFVHYDWRDNVIKAGRGSSGMPCPLCRREEHEEICGHTDGPGA